jgi:hypothetical protein
MKHCIVLFSFVLVLTISCTSNRKKILTEDLAIRTAEEFIKDNGYTNAPPTEDKSKLVPESIDGGIDNEGLKHRRDTLEPRAYGVIQGGRSGDGWYVVFRFNRDNPEYRQIMTDFEQTYEKYGRAVVMDRLGENLRVEHQDIGLEPKNLKRIVR